VAALASIVLGRWPELITGLIREHKLDQWGRLFISLASSYFVGFNAAGGAALIAGHGLLLALGAGMLGGVCSFVFIYVRSPLTKNIPIAIPASVIVQAEASDLTWNKRDEK